MDMMMIILLILGSIFALIGTVITTIFAAVGMGVFCLIPGLFIIMGLGMIVGVIIYKVKKNEARAKGVRYTGKIYGYIDNTTILVNGSFPVNIKVRYYDGSHVEREAIIPTSFPKGANQYPIGMTIDIFEYNGKYSWDPASVRSETIWGEAELMDNKPLEIDKLKIVAKQCPNCGAFFEASAGYCNRCPYCGSAIDA